MNKIHKDYIYRKIHRAIYINILKYVKLYVYIYKFPSNSRKLCLNLHRKNINIKICHNMYETCISHV